MAQIFISHSARDEELKNFFNKAFATSSVNAKYEEIEKFYQQTITTAQIESDIRQSSAVFVLVTPSVDSLPHTRDWVGYEIGYAKGGVGGNKDVWVFEHINDAGNLAKVIPNFDHYVVHDTSDAAFVYIKRIVESYDNGRVLRNLAVGAGGGAVLANKEDALGGAVVGAIASLFYSTLSTDRPQGVEVTCGCLLKYKLHLPDQMTQFRCPKCRGWYLRPGVVPQLA